MTLTFISSTFQATPCKQLISGVRVGNVRESRRHQQGAFSKRRRVGVTQMSLTETTLQLAVSSPALEVGKFLAGPCINLFNFVMIIRIILSWYPKTDLAKKPWIFIAVPTEPLLSATRKVIQPVGGVDISPIVWFAIMSFVHEILVGPQGLLVLLSQK